MLVCEVFTSSSSFVFIARYLRRLCSSPLVSPFRVLYCHLKESCSQWERTCLQKRDHELYSLVLQSGTIIWGYPI